MALPIDSRQLEDVASTTLDARLPDLIDNFFRGNPLAVRLLERDNIKEDGGLKITEDLIYDRLEGGSYRGMDPFNVAHKDVITQMQFDWKQYYVNITISGLTQIQNNGAKAVHKLVNTYMDIAKRTGPDMIGDDIFLDGSGNGGKAITGLTAGIDDGTTVSVYGGITRDTSTVGTAAKGNVNTTGGVFSLGFMNTEFGRCVIGQTKPDLIITTQTIWDKWWERAQPAQRFAAGNGANKMAAIGFAAISHNGADVVVDQHCPSGTVFFLNTEYMKMIVHSLRLWTFTGWKYPTNQDAMIGQLLWAGELIVQSPRLMNRVTNVT